MSASVDPVEAGCPPGESIPITSGTGEDALPVVLTGSEADFEFTTFFLLGSGGINNSDTDVDPRGDPAV